MFNSIIALFSKAVPQNAEALSNEADLDAAYDAYAAAMNEQYREGQTAILAEWNSLTNKEQREVIEWIDELNWRGDADSHRFYPYWRQLRCN